MSFLDETSIMDTIMGSAEEVLDRYLYYFILSAIITASALLLWTYAQVSSYYLNTSDLKKDSFKGHYFSWFGINWKFVGDKDISRSKLIGPTYWSFDRVHPVLVTTDLNLIDYIRLIKNEQFLSFEAYGISNAILRRAYVIMENPQFHFNSSSFLTNIIKRASANISSYIKVDSKSHLQSVFVTYAVEVLSNAVFGVDLQQKFNNSEEYIENLSFLYSERGYLPTMRMDYCLGHSKAIRYFIKFTNELISDRIKGQMNPYGIQPARPVDILEWLISEAKFKSGDSDDDFQNKSNEVVSQVLAILMFCMKPIVNVLSSAVHVLSVDVYLQNDLFVELNKVYFGMYLSKAMQVDKLNNFLKEVLRLYPIATRLYRRSLYSFKFNNVVYKQGTIFCFPVYALNRLEEHHHNPMEFNHKRFHDRHISKKMFLKGYGEFHTNQSLNELLENLVKIPLVYLIYYYRVSNFDEGETKNINTSMKLGYHRIPTTRPMYCTFQNRGVKIKLNEID